MPPNRFESEVESFLEGSHGDRTHIKRADHPRLHHYAGRYFCIDACGVTGALMCAPACANVCCRVGLALAMVWAYAEVALKLATPKCGVSCALIFISDFAKFYGYCGLTHYESGI